MTTSFSLEFIGSKLVEASRTIIMKDIATNKDYLYMRGKTSDNGEELWRTDGTESGTTLIKDIAEGSSNGRPSNFTVMEDISNNINYLYFSADNGTTNGRELWRSDGTYSGTTLVRDIRAGASDSSPFSFTVMEDISNNINYLYFTANNGINGKELWRSDGTYSGTTLVRDIKSGASASDSTPYNFTVMEDISNNINYLYFTADDGTNGRELWRSDGTESGTTLVKDIADGYSSPSYLTVMKDIANNKNYLYFSANNGTNGTELWRSDGTESGTTLLKDINAVIGSSGPSYLTVMEDISNNINYLYFNATDGIYGKELWRSDGTENGTTLVKDIMTGSISSGVSGLTVMEDIASNKNYLYFSANNGTEGEELWRSDGTESGTTLIKDIRTGSGSSEPTSFVVMRDIASNKNYLYFRAEPVRDKEYDIWRSDGTPEGTTFTASKDGFEWGIDPDYMIVMKDTDTNQNYLYFVGAADSDYSNYNLYRLLITNPSTVSITLMQNTAFVDNLETASLEKTELKTYLKSFYSSNKSSFNNKPVKLRKNTTLKGFTKPFPDKDIILLDGTNPAKMTKDELVGEQFLVITELNIPVTLPTLITDIEVKVTETSTDTFQVEKLSSNSTIETITLSSGDSYTLEGLNITLGSIIGSLVEPTICFKEGTQILTLDLNTGLDTYKNIENINTGDLVSTYKHGYVPVNIIGYSNLINTSSNSRITDKLYVYKKEDHQELIDDLYMTGGHSVLVDYKNINNIQRDKMIEEMGKLYKTDDKFRMMAKYDYRSDTIDDNRQYRVWHICLDHENEWMNYGIYANGMLVESTCERHAQNFLHKKENVVELIKDHCYLTSLLV